MSVSLSLSQLFVPGANQIQFNSLVRVCQSLSLCVSVCGCLSSLDTTRDRIPFVSCSQVHARHTSFLPSFHQPTNLNPFPHQRSFHFPVCQTPGTAESIPSLTHRLPASQQLNFWRWMYFTSLDSSLTDTVRRTETHKGTDSGIINVASRETVTG